MPSIAHYTQSSGADQEILEGGVGGGMSGSWKSRSVGIFKLTSNKGPGILEGGMNEIVLNEMSLNVCSGSSKRQVPGNFQTDNKNRSKTKPPP